MSIQNLVKTLITANTLSGIKAKKELIKNELDTVAQKGLRYILDPKITYGIKANKLPTHCGSMESEMEDAEVFELLDGLANRELTGNAAKLALETFSAESTPEAHRFVQLALKKSTSCGIGVTATNEIFPKLIPTFVVQKGKTFTSSLFNGWDLNPMLGDDINALVEEKENGWRVLAACNFSEQTVSYFTYTGNPVTSISHLDKSVLTLAFLLKFIDPRLKQSNIVWVDGEGVYMHGDEMGTLQEAASALGHQRDEVEVNIRFKAFDYFCNSSFEGASEVEPTKAIVRKERLTQAINELNETPAHSGLVSGVKTWRTSSEEEIFEIAERLISSGGEGIMIKNANAPYQFKKTSDWLKLKSVETFDGVIIEILTGDSEKGFENTMGRIGVLLEDNDKVVYCGGGFSIELRDEIYTNQDKYLHRKVELKAQEMTPDGSLQHARFGRFRDSEALMGEKA
ncbi:MULTISPECIES: ATP-dependent DNA ligase [Vibrio]|uniref:ATP-dependent DNA ligase n=1 Tax=Vibrio TaxID=662 RepID=UPI00078EA2B3|nr:MULTISPECIES: hypothetical protein [Vibrio]BAU70883.1 hypothetical protein [Vibrio sp. 04Ya108]BBM67860.1 DNA ligase [Vibrio alfacsensis]BCN27030.1 DNA ligase [Vibrio alfacsensis]